MDHPPQSAGASSTTGAARSALDRLIRSGAQHFGLDPDTLLASRAPDAPAAGEERRDRAPAAPHPSDTRHLPDPLDAEPGRMVCRPSEHDLTAAWPQSLPELEAAAGRLATQQEATVAGLRAAQPQPSQPEGSAPSEAPQARTRRLSDRELDALRLAELPATFSPELRRVHRAVLTVALFTARERGYASAVASVAFHLPVELLADELGVSRKTLYKHLRRLSSAGLIDHRGHRATVTKQEHLQVASRYPDPDADRGTPRTPGAKARAAIKREAASATLNRCDGTVWRVRLDGKRRHRARLTYDDLNYAWRDLEHDIQQGATVYAYLRSRKGSQSKDHPREAKAKNPPPMILQWAVNACFPKTPVVEVTGTPPSDPRFVDEATVRLRELRGASSRQRAEVIDQVGPALAYELRDGNSPNFYRKLAWSLAHACDAGSDHIEGVIAMLQRARDDGREGWARRPGAVLLGRLDKSGLLDELAPYGLGLRRRPAARGGIAA